MTEDRLLMIIKTLDFDRLTDWEIKFLEDAERDMKRFGKISTRREEIAEEIWEKYR